MSTAQPLPDDLSWDLADRLRKALRVSGVGVGEMATELAVSRNTVGNYINGHTEPNRATLRVWALRTGIPIEWILTGEIPGDDGDTPGGLGKPSTKWYTRYADSTVVALPTPTAQAA